MRTISVLSTAFWLFLKADIVKINRCRPATYQHHLSELKYDKGDMPMKLDGISKFESQNKGLAINVLSYNDNPVVTYVADDDVVMKHPHIDIVRRSNVADAKQIYLLLLEQKDNYHYVAVRNCSGQQFIIKLNILFYSILLINILIHSLLLINILNSFVYLI